VERDLYSSHMRNPPAPDGSRFWWPCALHQAEPVHAQRKGEKCVACAAHAFQRPQLRHILFSSHLHVRPTDRDGERCKHMAVETVCF